jgi:very-short-patch-repair endonuclease
MSTPHPHTPIEALDKAKQVFRFLRAFAERNLPLKRSIGEQPWWLLLSDLPHHPSVAVGEVRLAASGEVGEAREESVTEPLIRVRRPRLTAAPAPPPALSDWLQSGWVDPHGSIEVAPSRNVSRDNTTVTEEFSADNTRVAAFGTWQNAWLRWAEAERPARETMRMFERFYALHGRIALESERVELMLGDGRLRWARQDGGIDHPVLLQRVELEFDADVAEFRVVDADRSPELFGALLQGAEGVSSEQLNQVRIELEKGGYHPLAPESSGYLRRLAQLLTARGSFEDCPSAKALGPDPVVCRDPILFLRGRLSGFPAAFDRILEDLEERQQLPISLVRLVGIEPPAPGPVEPDGRSPWSEPPDVLLSKPANLEQIQIARALERHRAVLVQGPPGTGKSHTIANLIGHLVAHGKRVLVTSHATKALRVLRGQVVPELQPLCESVLENDLEGRTQMEQAVRGILSRLTVSNEHTLESEAANLAEARAQVNAEIDRLTADLRTIREAEYRSITVGGEASAPAEAARWVVKCREGNQWIPGRVEAGAPLPLSVDQVRDLYASNGKLTIEEEHELETGLPDPQTVMTPEQFSEAIRAVKTSEPPELAQFWESLPAEEGLPALEQLLGLAKDASTELARLEPWQRKVVAAGHAAGAEQELWSDLADQLLTAAEGWEKARPLLLEYEPLLDSSITLEEAAACSGEIVEHLKNGGSLGFMSLLLKPRWKAVVHGTKVNGHEPSKGAHFHAIGACARVEQRRHKIATRWTRQAEPAGLPAITSIPQPPEPILRDLAAQFDGLLSWWAARWWPIQASAGEVGLRLQAVKDREIARSIAVAPFERDRALLGSTLPIVVGARVEAAKRVRAERLLGELSALLWKHTGMTCGLLRAALRQHDAEAYREAYRALCELSEKTAVWRRRMALLELLAPVAPDWAAAVQRRESVHREVGQPGDPNLAWRWRQITQELDRRAGLDEISLTRQLRQRQDELRGITAQLIDRRAWLGQLRRTGLNARQALQGWADTQKRIGKGTGKRVPELQAKARELLEKARDAVPVWIMPLARVAEGFDPARARFDVVIVDEASQSDVTGLLAWYLADRVAVVGDHEQVSPLAVGQDVDSAKALIGEHLGGIPNSHLYDGKTSIYDLARASFGGTIALREHFRCVPDIIEFSNHLSYDGEIRPLRDPSTATRPHVVECIPPLGIGADRSGKTNLGEARMIAALVQAMTSMTEFDGQTMGAITLLGDEQAGRILDLTVPLVGAVELERRRFVAGNPAQFQGDERHVVFLSMVDTPTGGMLQLKQADLFKQRYNVAASRAKDQLWLVHSLDPQRDLKAGDLRRLLIEHVRDPGARQDAASKAVKLAESPFEKAVIERLIGAGYRVKAQVWVGRYRIDMVVSDGNHQAAVECDGDRYHGFEQVPQDMARQAVLERAGWRFIRIRGTRFYRDPASAMEWVWEELRRLEVEPVGPLFRESEDGAGVALRDEVLRRAWDIMRGQGWLPPVEGGVDPPQA